MRGRAHLDQAQRILPVIRAEVEVAQRQRLLEHGVVRLLQQRHHDRHVVPHVVAPDLVRAVGQPVRMRVARGAQQQQGGAQRAAGDHHDVGRILLELVVADHMHAADAAAGGVRLQPGDVGVGQQREIGVRGAGGIHADHLGVGLGVDRARKAVERVAADAGAVGGGAAVRVLVQLDAERQMERVQPLALPGCRSGPGCAARA